MGRYTHRDSLCPFEFSFYGRVIPSDSGEGTHIADGLVIDIQIVVRGILVGRKTVQVDVLFVRTILLLGHIRLVFLRE
jgi:hypothetical protein